MKQELVDQVAKTARKATENMHTALPGEIVKFDAAKGLASVQPKAKFKKPNGETLDFPVITGVPVVFPQSANVSIAWPIKPGDGCLIVFCESALDFWMYGKETDTALSFDLSNAVADRQVPDDIHAVRFHLQDGVAGLHHRCILVTGDLHSIAPLR